MQPVSLNLANPFTRTPGEFKPGVFEDARNENEGDLLARAGVMLLRFAQGSDECRLSVVAGMLAERHPFHKKPLKFFQTAAEELVQKGRLILDGDLLRTPVAHTAHQMIQRIAGAKQGVLSKMMALSLASDVVHKIKNVTTGIVALHGAVTDSSMQKELDQAFSRDLGPQLQKLDASLQKIERGILGPSYKRVNPGQKVAIDRERQDLLRNFR